MRVKAVLTAAAAWVVLMPVEAPAFQCPGHIAEAEEAITDVENDMTTMTGEMSADKMALVHALLDDAKAALAAAKHSHEDPQSNFDHARAIAKAKAALGYAQGADILHFQYMMKGGN